MSIESPSDNGKGQGLSELLNIRLKDVSFTPYTCTLRLSLVHAAENNLPFLVETPSLVLLKQCHTRTVLPRQSPPT